MALAATLIWRSFYKNQKIELAWLTYFLFLLNFALKQNLYQFWNPSFLVLFQVLVLLWIDQLNEKKYFYLTALVLGFSLQIHFSQLFLLLYCLYQIYKSYSIRQEGLKKSGLFLLLVLLPHLPFVLLNVKSTSYGSYQDAIKAFLFPVYLFFFNLLSQFEIKNLSQNWFLKEWLASDMFLFFLLLSVILNFAFFESIKKYKYYAMFLISSFSLIWIIYDPAFFRYSILFFILLSFILARGLKKLFDKSPFWLYFYLAFIVGSQKYNNFSLNIEMQNHFWLFLIVSFFAFIMVQHQNISKPYKLFLSLLTLYLSLNSQIIRDNTPS